MTGCTNFDLERAAEALVDRSTRAQGLPPKVNDPATLRRVAAVLRSADQPSEVAA